MKEAKRRHGIPDCLHRRRKITLPPRRRRLPQNACWWYLAGLEADVRSCEQEIQVRHPVSFPRGEMAHCPAHAWTAAVAQAHCPSRCGQKSGLPTIAAGRKERQRRKCSEVKGKPLWRSLCMTRWQRAGLRVPGTFTGPRCSSRWLYERLSRYRPNTSLFIAASLLYLWHLNECWVLACLNSVL